MGLSVAVRHEPGRLGRQSAARALQSGLPIIGESGRGQKAVGGEECGFRSRLTALDPGRAAPHLSAQHMCAEAAVHEAWAVPLWQRKSPLPWQV